MTPLFETPIVPPALREYQVQAVENLRAALRAGFKRIILNSPTGSGKTLTSCEIIRGAQAKGKKVAFLANRIHLVNQTARVLAGYGIDCGVIQGQNTYEPWRSVLVCSIQTIAKRGMPDVDLIVLDECFRGSTLIATPGGLKQIDLVRCGDLVYNGVGMGVVESVTVRPATETYQLEFDDGTRTECTGNHPFFTPLGWKAARELAIGTHLFSVEGLRLLWETIPPVDQDRCERETDIGSFGIILERANVLLDILCQEIKEPNEQPSVQIKNESKAAGDKTQTDQARRERAIASLGTVGAFTCARGRVGVGVFSDNPSLPENHRVPSLLQVGHSEPSEDDRDRVRRGVTRLHCEAGVGPEEDRPSYFPGLVRISRVERESSVPVFNLQVGGHPSFFADGKLVHNCHSAAGTKAYRDVMIDIPVVGLTATPYSKGLGKEYPELGGPLFEKVITAAKIMDLIRDGFLVSAEIWAPSEPDLSKVRVVAGEYDERQLAEAVDKPALVGDIVTHWLKLAGGASTVVFATNIAHSKHIRDEFLGVGVKCEHIDAYSSDEDRKAILERVNTGETTIITNCSVLAEGWDCPRVKVGILARPTKSLIRYLQMAGRLLRPYQGVSHALILDHSGVVRRLGFPWDSFDRPLDDGKPKESKGAEKKEPLPKPCPQCSFMKPPRTPICPSCGFNAQPPNGVEVEDGELVQLTGKTRKPKLIQMAELGKQTIYSQLLDYAAAHGYRSGWIAHKYKEVFQVWPRGMAEESQPCSLEVANWIRSQNIKFHKANPKVRVG